MSNTTPLTPGQKLVEAETALHSLMIGESEVSIMRNGKSVTFQATNVEKLEQYIAQLKACINPSLRRRALSVTL